MPAHPPHQAHLGGLGQVHFRPRLAQQLCPLAASLATDLLGQEQVAGHIQGLKQPWATAHDGLKDLGLVVLPGFAHAQQEALDALLGGVKSAGRGTVEQGRH